MTTARVSSERIVTRPCTHLGHTWVGGSFQLPRARPALRCRVGRHKPRLLRGSSPSLSGCLRAASAKLAALLLLS